MSSNTFTSESVCSGHPDKICDQVSDSILDEALKKDKYSRVAVETLATKNLIVLAGELTTNAKLNYKNITRSVVKKLGYNDPKHYFTNMTPIIVKIHTQSPEIAQGVDNLGAGDQGMMFGYACRDTKELMPLPIMIAHKLVSTIDQMRNDNSIPFLLPDGKSQVTTLYEKGRPKRVLSVVLAVPHIKMVDLKEVRNDLLKKIVKPVLESFGFSISATNVIVNGTGVWHLPGPASDTGVTGRKIIVDTYGGMARVGGGAFSGKDPTKVDRSGAYAARFLAKNIVAAGLADRCEVRLAYFIGAKKPLMQEVETFGTEKASPKKLNDFMTGLLDTSVKGIISGLKLLQPIYFNTASYGHFGREEFPWEKVVI